MVVDVIKRIFSKPAAKDWGEVWGEVEEPGVPSFLAQDSPAFTELLTRLKMSQEELDRLKRKLVDELHRLKESMIIALKNNDKDTAETIAADIVLKKKVLKGIIAYIKLLSIMESRLETARTLDNVTAIARYMDPILRGLGEYIESVSPEFVATLYSTRDVVSQIYRSTSALADTMPSKLSITEFDSEVRDLIKQAMEEAHIESEALVPEVPKTIDYEELEAKLIDYIKARNGIISLKAAARDLGVSPKVVKEVLYRLASKGIITVSKNKANAEATPA